MIKKLIICMLLALQGCATPDYLTEQQGQALLVRVEQRWDALSEYDYERAWEYATRAYREVFTSQLYAQKYGMYLQSRLTSADIINYDSKAGLATVLVTIVTRNRPDLPQPAYGAIATTSTHEEYWKRADGSWYVIVPK